MAVSPGRANTDSGVSFTPEEHYIEIRGREGSSAVHRKLVNGPGEVSDADVQKILGIARRLPPVAFDALLDPQTIELMLNPDGRMIQETLGGEMRRICYMRAFDAEEFIRRVAGFLKGNSKNRLKT